MKIKITLIIAFIIHLSVYSQWVQTGGPNGGNANEIIQMGSELILSAGNGGIYKSLDNGTSWKLSISGLPCNEGVTALFESNGLLYTTVNRNGIYLSEDRGNNWKPINTGIENLTFYSLFVDGSNIYAGNSEGSVYYSSDGGFSWSNKSNGISNGPPVVHHIKEFIKYNSKIYAAGEFLYESSNNGDTWVKVSIPNLNANGIRALLVHNNIFFATSEGVVYASSGGLVTWDEQIINNNGATITGLFSFNNVVYCTTSLGRYYYTNDNGAHWTGVQNTTTQSRVKNLFFIDNSIIMSTMDGLYKTNDNGVTWLRNNNGISALTIKSLEKNKSYLFAGTDSNGIFRSANKGQSWTLISNGLNTPNSLDIGEIFAEGNSIVIATSDGIYHSTNNGDSWVKKLNPGSNKSTQGLDYNNGVFVTAVSGTGVYISSDNGQTWNLSATNGLDTDTSYYSVKINKNVIVVSTHNGEMYISKDLGNTWSDISIKSNFQVTFDFEFINNKLYAATSKGLMVSTDLGQNWNPFNGDSKSINDVLFDDDKLYIATNMGIYVANEKEKLWYSLCDGIGKQFTNKLLINNDLLFAGTFSASVWKRLKIEDNLPPKEDSSTIGIERVSLCSNSNPVNLYSKIGISSDSKGVWTPNLSAANGTFNPLLDTPGIYTFTFDSDLCGCENYLRIEVTLDGQANAGNDSHLSICKENSTINLFESLDGNPDSGGIWSPPLASGTDVFNPTLDSEVIYIYTVSSLDCGTDSSTIVLKIEDIPNAGKNTELSVCSKDSTMDLLAHLDGNPDSGGTWSPTLSTNTNLFNPSIDSFGIYTYTVNNGDCASVSELNITVIEEPDAGIDGALSICLNSDSVNLFDYLKGDPDAGGTWLPLLHDGNGIFNPSKDMAGTYTYTTTSICNIYSSEVFVSVMDKSAISNYKIDVIDFSNSNSITVTVDSGLHYEYSLDGILFQKNTVFNNLKGGNYTVFGREVNGCGFFQKDVFLLDYPKFFTPNNDGYNDFWHIKGISNETYNLFIFDRYGKLLKICDTTSNTWDGTYNGNPMPTTDYWFKIIFEDGRIKSGHFALKR